MPAAPSATDAACSQVLVALPDEVGGLARQETTAQATAAWSDGTGPARTVTLRCGITEPGPTTDACTTIDGVDWITDSTSGEQTRQRTFGRSPAIEVLFPESHTDGADLLLATVSAVAKAFPQTRQCL